MSDGEMADLQRQALVQVEVIAGLQGPFYGGLQGLALGMALD